MHVQGTIQVLKTAVLHVLVRCELVNVDVHFHLRVSTVVDCAHMCRNVVREQSGLVEVAPLVDGLLSRRIELDHHR